MSGGQNGRRAGVVVLASGNGSNFQALVDASSAGVLDADVTGLVTDQREAFAIRRATAAGVPVCIVERGAAESRSDYDARLADAVGSLQPDLVVLGGWMRLLTMTFLGRFPRQVVNLHPALPGEFPGIHAIERAHEAAKRVGLRRTGAMVHYVPDEGMDDGPTIACAEVVIHDDDTIESLSQRVHAAEHELLVAAVGKVLAANCNR